MKELGVLSDYLFEYALAWFLILTSPLWFPVWYAHKLHKWAKNNPQ